MKISPEQFKKTEQELMIAVLIPTKIARENEILKIFKEADFKQYDKPRELIARMFLNRELDLKDVLKIFDKTA